jgi:hypothetical protein
MKNNFIREYKHNIEINSLKAIEAWFSKYLEYEEMYSKEDYYVMFVRIQNAVYHSNIIFIDY